MGGLVAFLIAAVMTFIDWRLNPGGIFRGPAGADWQIVWDTWISWFLPVFPVAALLALVILGVVSRRG